MPVEQHHRVTADEPFGTDEIAPVSAGLLTHDGLHRHAES